MVEPEHLQRLQRLARSADGPLRVEVREVFCEHVERIKDAEVYCIGVALASPGLRALKDAWIAESPEDQRKVHVPYDSEGHISLAYIRGEFRDEARSFVAEHGPSLQDGRGMLVDHISYEDEFGRELPIALGSVGSAPSSSAAEGPRPGKGARRGPGPSDAGAVVDIDGSILEGGGQILRMSSSYSALFGQPIRISKIRASRPKPGLAAQHLESLRLVRDVCHGTLTNDRVGSCEVVLTPKALGPGSFTANPGTAGAITLMVQASLMPLIFAGGPCFCDLRGGTDVSFSPPLDFLARVLLPTLRRMGVVVDMECMLRGFFPKGGGQVKMSAQPLSGPLAAIDMSERGEPARVEAVLYSTQPPGGNDQGQMIRVVRQAFSDVAPQVNVAFSLAPAPNNSWKYWLDVVVETTTGALFHGGSAPQDLPWPGKAKGKGGGSLPDLFYLAAEQAKTQLQQQLSYGAAVEVHLADQLILPASLAAGTSRLLVAELSMHTRTAIHIAQLLVPEVTIREEKRGDLNMLEIDGVAYEPPAPQATPSAPAQAAAAPRVVAPPKSANEDVLQLPPGSLSKAKPEMISEFMSDMKVLAGDRASVRVDLAGDRLVITGNPKDRQEALAELRRPDGVLPFYSIYL